MVNCLTVKGQQRERGRSLDPLAEQSSPFYT